MFEHIPLILAQVEPVSPLGGFFDLFLKNGLLGAAVAILVWFLYKRDVALQASQEARLADAKSLAEVVKNHTIALQATNTADDERNRALEVSSRAAERSVTAIEQISRDMQELKLAIKGK